MKDESPAWPVIIFESDGYFQRVDSPRDLDGLYEDDMWDEIVAAFDARQCAIAIDVSDGNARLTSLGNDATSQFVAWARKGIKRMWRVTRIRVVRANREQAEWVDSLSVEELWNELHQRSE